MKTSLLEGARISMESEAVPLVQDFINIEDVIRDTSIDPHEIGNNLLAISPLYARYSLLVAKARIQRDGFKSRRNLMAAQLEKVIRDDAVIREEKVTNPQVLSRVTGDSRMVCAELNLNEASAVLAACQETLNAIKIKRDMLVQLNKNRQAGWSASDTRVPLVELSAVVPKFGEPVELELKRDFPAEALVLPDISDCM